MKPWQKGYELDYLKEITRRFKEHDGDRCLGAFVPVKENTVANWLAEGRLFLNEKTAIAHRIAKTTTTVTDFRGVDIASFPPGTLIVERVASASPKDLSEQIQMLAQSDAGQRPILWKAWADKQVEQSAAAIVGLLELGTVVRASSEILTVYGIKATDWTGWPADHDLAGISPIHIPTSTGLTEQDLADIALWPSIVERQWVDHYSSYNKRRSWHAVALRSFGGSALFIEKPAEMSKAWKAEHLDLLAAEIQDTPLYDQLPGARRILGRFPCDFERVRLMRLTSGGELSRHADIIDRNAGTANGKIARLHLPIQTSPSVEFTSWNYRNEAKTVHMSLNHWWYLDVRKPHRAINPGQVERIHLVADAVSNQEIRLAISNGIIL